MKRFNRIFASMATAAACAVLLFSASCKEDDTLGGAKAVYIEINQTDISLLVGDTVRLSARVSNVSGKDIATSITWSVDDPTVVDLRELTEWSRKKNSGYVAPPAASTEPAETDEADETEGEVTEEVSEFDADGTPRGTRNADGTITSPDGRYIYTPTRYWAIIGRQGAQGKETNLRATIENGKFAMTTVSVERSSLGGLLAPEHEVMASYFDNKDDVAWFQVEPIGLVDEYDVRFDIAFDERFDEGTDEFRFMDGTNEDGSQVIRVDRENSRIGIAFLAPKAVGKATCTITIGNDEEEAKASMQIYVLPLMSGGFEELDASGQPRRPTAAEETPSNLKSRNLTKTMDINAVDSVGVCIYVRGDETDRDNAVLAQEAGYVSWEIDGSAIVVEKEYVDRNYLSANGLQAGFVSYLKVRSGARSGSARVTMTTPARFPEENDQNPYEYESAVFVCDITVNDFEKAYPVEDIVITYDGRVLENDAKLSIDFNKPFSLDVDVKPEESFGQRIPQVTSSNPEVLSVNPRNLDDGVVRNFTIHKPGTTVLTFSSHTVTKQITVVVEDVVSKMAWVTNPSVNMIPGSTANVAVNLYMASDPDRAVSQMPEGGKVTWTSSDPNVARVEADASDSRKAVVTTLTEGTTTITAMWPDCTPVRYELTVAARQGVEYTDANTTYRSITDYGDQTGYLYLETADNSTVEFYFSIPNGLTGTATGSDGALVLDASEEMPCSYSLTFTGKTDGTVVVNGTVTLTEDGTVYTFTNLTMEIAD